MIHKKFLRKDLHETYYDEIRQLIESMIHYYYGAGIDPDDLFDEVETFLDKFFDREITNYN